MTLRSIFLLGVLITLTSSFAKAIADAPPTVWAADPAIVKTLQTSQVFGDHSIELPESFTLVLDKTFRDNSPWTWQGTSSNTNVDPRDVEQFVWHGDLRPDGTRAVIEIWVIHLDANMAAGDVYGYGESLLANAGQSGVTKYIRGKDETGIDKSTGLWMTRFPATCVLPAASGIDVALTSENYIWLDKSDLMLATAYDATTHAKETQSQLEASLWSVHSE